MINFKQQELIDELLTTVRKKYPEVKLIDITHSPEDPHHIWVNTTGPEDEDREIELSEYAAELETDILMDYGYRISLMIEPTCNVT